MSTLRLPYRLRQAAFYQSRQVHIALPSDAAARLTPPMEHQFRILSEADQHHLVKVYTWLTQHNAADETVTAGLIHDVGKACAKCRITVLDRGLHVVLSRFAKFPYRRFARIENPPALLRGLHRMANHPERGALAAIQAGYSDRIAWLVQYHESGGDSNDAELRLLRTADDMAERS